MDKIKSDNLEKISILLNINKEDVLIQSQLSEVYDEVSAHLLFLISEDIVPKKLQFLINKTVRATYNNLQNEGKTSSKIDVVSDNFIVNYLNQFSDLIEQYKKENKPHKNQYWVY